VKIIHHMGLRAGEQERAALLKAGVELPSGVRSLGMVSFEIAEDDPRWENIGALLERFRVFDTTRTEFSVAELGAAKYLGMVSSWQHGYPEPSDDGAYLKTTFDLTDYCRACGIGLRQVAPFRLKKAPPWGRRSFLQLNWMFDEFFVKPDVWTSIFQPLGIGCRPVVVAKTGARLDSVVQLDITEVCDLKLEGVDGEECPSCGRKKYPYRPVLRGFHPAPSNAAAPAFKSSQYFGSGASAFRAVLVSNSLYRKISDAGLKGVVFCACAEPPS
jgi:hypothetical protein